MSYLAIGPSRVPLCLLFDGNEMLDELFAQRRCSRSFGGSWQCAGCSTFP